MIDRVLLYGATGFTGREIAHQLREGEGAEKLRGKEVVLAGRDATGVRALAAQLKCEWRAFPLTDPIQVEAGLRGIRVVLNAAGPFAVTARPMMDACLKHGVHYLDLSGEWPTFLEARARDMAARATGVTLLPGVGLTIAATDCLLAHAVSRWPKTVTLRLGVSQAQVISRGSVDTAARLAGPDALIRRGGAVVGVPAGSLTHAFDFGDGLREATAVSWADVVTGEVTTGVKNIEVYSELGWPTRVGYWSAGLAMSLTGPGLWRRGGRAMAALWPSGPSKKAREDARFVMVVEALDPWRRPHRLRMRTRDGYTVSVLTAVEAVKRTLSGDIQPGFQTPALAFGRDFVFDVGAAALEEAVA